MTDKVVPFKKNEREQGCSLDSIVGYVRLLSSAFDPTLKPVLKQGFWNLRLGEEYAKVWYRTGEEKQRAVTHLGERLPNHLPVLVEVQPKKRDIIIGDYLFPTQAYEAQVWLLSDEFEEGRKKVSPKIAEDKVDNWLRIFSKDQKRIDIEIESLLANPLFVVLMGLPEVKEYKAALNQGVLPYVVVDAFPGGDVSCEPLQIKYRSRYYSDRIEEGTVDNFYQENFVYHRLEQDRFILRQAIPIVFLVPEELRWKVAVDFSMNGVNAFAYDVNQREE